MPKKLKIVYMGTPEFAIPPLQALLNHPNMEIQAVITQPDKKVGRKQLLTPTPVKTFALQNNLPVLQPITFKENPELIDLLKNLEPDFMIVVAYGQILPKNVLQIPKFGCLNIHPSLLPKYRGATPVEQALINGDTQTGVTIIKMDKGMDSGDIVYVQRLEIKPEDNAETLLDKLFKLGAIQLPFLIKDLVDGVIQPIPQNSANASYCHKITKEDGLIELGETTARQIINKMKAYTPWPNCYLKIEGKTIKILEAVADEDSPIAKKAQPSQVINLENGMIGLGTKTGILIPLKVQLEGKNATSIKDFLRGYPAFFQKLTGNS